ncbi:MAG: M36 family metallopeptidase [Acidobacteria bacterium]|nr:M36 family metallopeptidase [Acidobacteriota bacterium]MCB9378422.1 M36 family metallopeptidase [Holophagales bacterium]
MHPAQRTRLARSTTRTLALLLLVGAAPSLAARSEAAYLTQPSEAPAAEVASSFLENRADIFGVAAADLAEAALTDVVPTRHNGVTHFYYRQRVNGIEVDGAELSVHIDRLGRVFHVSGHPIVDLANRASETRSFPLLSHEDAIQAAASRLGLGTVQALDLLDASAGPDRAARFANPSVSEEPIPVRLRYFRTPDGDRLTLAWNLWIKDPRNPDWWNLWIDAETGDLVGRDNWTDYEQYQVFAQPKESPFGGGRTIEVNPYTDGTGSPFGWHDTNGVAGPEFTSTRGNNVRACVDADANNACDGGSEPDGGGALDFTGALVPLDLANDQPAAYQPAAVVNLFYWNNIMHDVLYEYGFDEPAGNFQVNNYGNGGSGNDAVNADAQDGSGTNNANFSTPSDGLAPRMQMFRWTAPNEITVNAPAPVAGGQVAGTAGSGWGGQTGYNVTQDLTYLNDQSGVADDGCCNDGNTLCTAPQLALWNVTGKIALLRRGQCEFGTKAVNAQNAGAIGVILINNVDTIISMGPGVNGASATIPILSIPMDVGATWLANQSGLNATMDATNTVAPDRDSDLDAGVIAHEYGHGVSNRLTGGPSTTSCLTAVEQQGEGWSDWQTLFLNASPGDTSTTSRAVGSYVNFDDFVPLAAGIRRYPYSTDMGVNPLTYASIADTLNTQPHGIGVIWATTIWEMYWNLVDRYGYDADIYYGSGGNNLAYQLVLDGMKLQPCGSGLSFPSSRDAILAADTANYEGENYCEIWRAFGKRGVGVAASTGGSNNDRVVTEDFTIPAECLDLIFSDGFGMAGGAPRFDGFSRWSSVVGAP